MELKRKRSDQNMMYIVAKEQHEKECFKLLHPAGLFMVLDEPTPKIMSKAGVRKYYGDAVYFDQDESHSFIKEWLTDLHMKKMERVVVDPREKHGSGVYNLWEPFRAASIENEANEEELTRPIIDYILKHVAEGASSEWLLNYLARMVQYPESKSEMALWLHGEEKCGKSVLFDFICDRVFGSGCSLQITDQLLRGNNAVGRVCIQVHGVKKLDRRLSDLIMMKTLRLDGGDVHVTNLVNLIVTSNSPPPEENIHIAGFQCTAPEDLDALRAHLERDDVARAFYQYLMRRRLPSWAGFRKFMRHTRP